MNEDAYRSAESAWWRKLGAAPTERFVPLASTGTSIRVQELGDGDPVLFIHGGANSGTGFAPLAKRLADAGRRCMLVDRPGNGLSPPAAPKTQLGLPDWPTGSLPT